jgi:hypothetical protein
MLLKFICAFERISNDQAKYRSFRRAIRFKSRFHEALLMPPG